MFSGNYVFSQIMDYLPWPVFHQCVVQYNGDKYIKTFNCSDQYRCMAFAQLTYRSSLRDFEIGLRSHAGKLYYMGIRSGISRNNLSNADQSCDWRIYAKFFKTQLILHGVYMLMMHCLALIQKAPYMPWIRAQLISVCHYFSGRTIARVKVLSRCILFSIYTVTSQFTYIFPTESCMM